MNEQKKRKGGRVSISAATILVVAALTRISLAGGGGPIAVQDVWSFPAIVVAGDPEATAVVYLEVINRGKEPDRLLGAKSGVCRVAELHDMKIVGDVMRMEPIVGGIEIPAGESVRLAPGGKHLMLVGLKRSLSAGERFSVELDFAKSGTLTVESIVKSP